MTLRIGIVGAGGNTRLRHIPGFLAIDGVEVVAVCNRSQASGRKVAEEFGIGEVFEDWQDLVASDSVDAVCIGTWPYMHCPITIGTLEAGKHVLTEARMAMNLDEARHMRAAAAASNSVAMVVPAPFFLETEASIVKRVQDNFFGELLDIDARGLNGAFDPEAAIHWRQRSDYSGKNILAMGILNETLRRYAGDERSVTAHGKVFTTERLDQETGARRAANVPESLGIVAEMESGATAVYHLSSVARLGEGFSLECHGTLGAFRLTEKGAWIAGETDSDWRLLELPEKERGGWRVEQDFVDSIRDGTAVTHTNFDDGVKYMAFTEATHRSLAEGRKVELPL